ncbi:hypothetical protein ZG96_004463 [Salmonella enterica subsp. enterica serovar Java]|nr:hypothetical protein [Salmonella enterica subsp. enterica serovar Java]EHN1697437.1 hypothetical protein [Salmonella enterica subsp. enterica serovar Newport]EJC3483669.1 hypothetical protein [Salmonella enterica]
MATLEEMLAKCSPESLTRIAEKTEELRREVLRQKLNNSQATSQTEKSKPVKPQGISK